MEARKATLPKQGNEFVVLKTLFICCKQPKQPEKKFLRPIGYFNAVAYFYTLRI
jgi:hypothetical protein